MTQDIRAMASPESAPPPRPGDEAALLAAAQRGDHVAFTALIERHARLVHGYLRARLTRLADVEDLGQEVFLRVYTAKASPREIGRAHV